MYFTYILRSETTGVFYKGHTQDLSVRLLEHNNGKGGSFTKKHVPWVLLYSEQYQTRAEAMKRERYLKSGKGREWIQKNVLEQSAAGG